MDKIEVRNLISGRSKTSVQGIFIFVGHIPNTRFLEGKVRLTGSGYIPTSDRMKQTCPASTPRGTSAKGTAPDRHGDNADGAIAAVNAVKYVEEFE